MLHRSGLVIADVAGQGRQLEKRRGENPNAGCCSNAVSNILCIRFKGFDPERLLNFLYPYFRWFFSVPAVVFCLLLALSALLLGRWRNSTSSARNCPSSTSSSTCTTPFCWPSPWA